MSPLCFKAPASVTVENDTLVVKEGSNVTLFCIVSGFPSPSVSWVNNKSELMEAGNIWRIPNITRNYTGEYNCSASNACGNDTKEPLLMYNVSHCSPINICCKDRVGNCNLSFYYILTFFVQS